MKLTFGPKNRDQMQFNMTAMIDVVFLLIIFFMLICQFIVRENYELVLPDDCVSATVPDRLDRNAVTVSVVPREVGADQGTATTAQWNGNNVIYAVRAAEFDPLAPRYRQNPQALLRDMTEAIQQDTARRETALVHLRADSNMTYGQVQQVLVALSQAQVRQVQLAAFRGEQNNNHATGNQQ
ncbi:MAG: biopolymer transporter ExbD [Sedimentisphaerales bacterium]|nr:biopolymer transporter ExbD [Sedimentisphaerales bacterium]